MMKPTQIWLGLLTSILLATAQADTAETTQTIRLSIPVVALLDIGDISPAFTFEAPLNAGDGLSVSATHNFFGAALSSNNPQANLDIKIDQDLAQHGIAIFMSDGDLGGCVTSLTLTTTDQTFCEVGTTQTSSGTMRINAAAESHGMAAYGDYSVKVTYTLTDD